MPTTSLLPALLAAAVLCPLRVAVAQEPPRVRLRLDTTEAVTVLRLVADTPSTPAGQHDWQQLLVSEGYRRLHDREAAMHRPFTDSAFAVFVHGDSLRARAVALRRALSDWERADLGAAAARALAYLPRDANIAATIYLVIKPRTNSFVWEAATNPAIFLYLDPNVNAATFANTVAHELHHIGYASVGARVDAQVAALPDSARAVAEWIGAFGEGFAMLAAAGGPDVHPHATSSPEDRARWDADMAHFNSNLRAVDAFFLALLRHGYPSADSAQAVGMSFFGIQGPWYTVGWQMAVMIERQLGRAELLRCMFDPYRLLSTYNRLATEYNRTHADSLAVWSTPVVAAIAPRSAAH